MAAGRVSPHLRVRPGALCSHPQAPSPQPATVPSGSTDPPTTLTATLTLTIQKATHGSRGRREPHQPTQNAGRALHAATHLGTSFYQNPPRRSQEHGYALQAPIPTHFHSSKQRPTRSRRTQNSVCVQYPMPRHCSGDFFGQTSPPYRFGYLFVFSA